MDRAGHTPGSSNFVERGFEQSWYHPGRLLKAMLCANLDKNYVSNVYGRLLGHKFLKHLPSWLDVEMGQAGVFEDSGRPFLIVNGSFHGEEGSERFEMTPLFSGSPRFGYVRTSDLLSSNRPVRVRDAMAISGGALSFHVHVPYWETLGFGLSREGVDYRFLEDSGKKKHLDLSDGGFVDNLVLEALVHRGCSRVLVVDAEYDPEHLREGKSGQAYESWFKWVDGLDPSEQSSMREQMQESAMDEQDQMVTFLQGSENLPSLLYIKLKSNRSFNNLARTRRYNRPDGSCPWGREGFRFDPHGLRTGEFETSFSAPRNLSSLGEFCVHRHAQEVLEFFS